MTYPAFLQFLLGMVFLWFLLGVIIVVARWLGRL